MVSAAKGGESVQVVVRVRPMSDNEIKGGKYIKASTIHFDLNSFFNFKATKAACTAIRRTTI